MADALAEITENELSVEDVRGIRALLQRLRGGFNAALNTKIYFNTGRNRRTITDAGEAWEFDIKQAVADADAAGPPSPFALVQVTAGANAFKLNANSFLSRQLGVTDIQTIANATATFSFADGDSVWLQVDTAGDTGTISEVNIAKGQTAPYEGAGGGALLKFSGSGSPDDPYTWDESYCPLAQVFAADASGKPVRGGVVYSVGANTKIEIVQKVFSHLVLDLVYFGAQAAYLPVLGSGPLTS